jgi:hypothetical protein
MYRNDRIVMNFLFRFLQWCVTIFLEVGSTRIEREGQFTIYVLARWTLKALFVVLEKRD